MTKKQRIAIAIPGAILALILIIGLWVFADYRRNGAIERVRAKGGSFYLVRNRSGVGEVLAQMDAGTEAEALDWNPLYGSLMFLHNRFDTSDFRLPDFARLLYRHGDAVPTDVMADMKKTLIDFKYWQSYPGDDGMCYWSENHQLLFSSGEYLLGSYWPDETFGNNGITGAEHAVAGKERVLTWLEQRWNYGVVEWNSNVYYAYTIDPLLALIELAPDPDIQVKAAIILDLLMYDVASQSYQGTFVSNSGRAYTGNRIWGRKTNIQGAIDWIWPEFAPLDENGNPVERTGRRGLDNPAYHIPEVFREIGLHGETAVIKNSTGLNLTDLDDLGFIGIEDQQIMMQWAMESFSNRETIANTLRYVDRYDMFTNEFLNDLALVNIGFLRIFGLLPAVNGLLKPQSDGTAIQRSDAYLYRTPNYAMSTSQAYHPGTYGDQHHLFALTLDYDVSLFHSHPATALGGGALGGSPGYWVGYGRIPHQAQEENVNMAIYQLGDSKGFMEGRLYDFTHYYLPERFLDEVVIDGSYAFARKGDRYVALIGQNNLFYVDQAFLNEVGDFDPSVEGNFTDVWEGREDYDDGQSIRFDLIQPGRESYWITEVGIQAEYGDFEAFQEAIRGRFVDFQNGRLDYQGPNNRAFSLEFGGNFSVNGQVRNFEYDRYDSPYARVERGADTMMFQWNGRSLYLDFENSIRQGDGL